MYLPCNSNKIPIGFRLQWYLLKLPVAPPRSISPEFSLGNKYYKFPCLPFGSDSNINVGAGRWLLVAAIFVFTPVFQCASVVLAAGIEYDRHLFLATVTTLTSFVLSSVFKWVAAAGFRAAVDAG